jgi:phage head maturation protease
MPALLWQHDPSKPIGVYEDMREDDTGLYVKGRSRTRSSGATPTRC